MHRTTCASHCSIAVLSGATLLCASDGLPLLRGKIFFRITGTQLACRDIDAALGARSLLAYRECVARDLSGSGGTDCEVVCISRDSPCVCKEGAQFVSRCFSMQSVTHIIKLFGHSHLAKWSYCGFLSDAAVR